MAPAARSVKKASGERLRQSFCDRREKSTNHSAKQKTVLRFMKIKPVSTPVKDANITRGKTSRKRLTSEIWEDRGKEKQNLASDARAGTLLKRRGNHSMT